MNLIFTFSLFFVGGNIHIYWLGERLDLSMAPATKVLVYGSP